MAVLRQNSYNSQQRVDVPHLRSIESAICADFDILGGKILAGKSPLIVKGFTIPVTSTVGTSASNLVLNVAGGLLLHYGASDSGTLFAVPDTQAAEALVSTNSKVSGAFTANSTNYVGLDLARAPDDSTSDLVKFWAVDTKSEDGETVPLARTLSYRIVISTQNFTASSNIAPIAIVVTNAQNNITSITDARKMMFRLGSGGDAADASHAYAWGNRTENSIIYDSTHTSDPFTAEDKSLNSFKGWADAIMTRLWELGSGEHWYSPTSRDNVKIVYGQPVISATGDNFQWTSGTNTLTYKSISLLFSNTSSAYYNVVTDGSQVLNADGQCVYVDLDRTTNGASLVAKVGTMESLGSPSVPGSRFIIAWRQNGYLYARDRSYEVGRPIAAATTSTLGTVQLNNAPGSNSNPLVPAIGANGELDVTATANNSHAIKGTGNGTGDGVQGAASGGGYGLHALSGGVKLDSGAVTFPDNSQQTKAALSPKVLSGQAADGATVNFSSSFTSAPKVILWGGKVFSTALSTAYDITEDFQAQSVTADTFVVYAKLKQTQGTTTAENIDGSTTNYTLTDSNGLTTVNSQALTPGASVDNTYVVHYDGSLTVHCTESGTIGTFSTTGTLNVHIDGSVDGTNWTNDLKIDTYSKTVPNNSSGTAQGTQTIAADTTVTLAGMTASGMFRIRITAGTDLVVNQTNGAGSASYSVYLDNSANSSGYAVTYTASAGTLVTASKGAVNWMAIGT